MVTWLILLWFLIPEGHLPLQPIVSPNSRDTETRSALPQKPPPEKPPPQKPPKKPPINPDSPGGPAAAAGGPPAPSQSARGTVTAVSVDSLIVKSNDGKEWTFSVDSKTKVIGLGAGTKMAKTKKAGKSLTVPDLVGNGDTVIVSYQEIDGKMRASELRISKKK